MEDEESSNYDIKQILLTTIRENKLPEDTEKFRSTLLDALKSMEYSLLYFPNA